MSDRTRLRRILAVLAPVLVTLLLGAVVQWSTVLPELVDDAEGYDRMARRLSGDEDAGSLRGALIDVASRGYAYPTFLTATYAVTGGSNPELAAWLQALVVLPLTTLFVYFAGRTAFSRPVGIVAAWGFALWLPALLHASWIMPETLLALLMAALAAVLGTTLVHNTPRLGFLAGLTTGVLTISHPAYQTVWLGLLLAFVALARVRRLAFPFALGAAILVVPYAFFSTTTSLPRLGDGVFGYGGAWGAYATSRWETGFKITPADFVVARNLLNVDALKRRIDAGTLDLEPELRDRIQAKAAAGGRLTDADFYELAVANLLDRPDKWPDKAWRNTTILLAYSRGEGEVNGEPRWLHPVWRPAVLLLSLSGVAGLLVVLLRRRDRLLVFVPMIMQLLVLLPLSAQSRYAIPLWPSMLVLAAFALVTARDWAISRRARCRPRSLDPSTSASPTTG